MPSEGSFHNLSEFPHRPFPDQLNDPFRGGMPVELRGAYQLVPLRPYLQPSTQESHASVTQYEGTHYSYPPPLTP